MVPFKMSKNKRICFFTVSHPQYGLGGAELQTYYLAREFVRNGWEVFFLTEKKRVRTNFNASNDGIKTVEYTKGKNFVKTGINILGKLLTIKPHYVYYRYHKFHIGFIWFCALLTDCRYFWVPMHNDYCDRNAAIRVNFDKIIQITNLFKRIFFRLKLQMEKALFVMGVKHSSGIIVQNEIQMKIIKKEFKPEKISKVYNGHQLPTKIEKKKYDIIFVATLKDFKRPFFLFEILKELRFPVRVVMVGKNFSDERKAKRILELIKKYNIEYLGELVPEEVNTIIARSKILVNTSSEEGFPNTFIQAWLRGVPVVSLAVDPDSLISKHGLGFVCNDNLREAVEKIDMLVKDKDSYIEISRRCEIFARENFSIENKSKEVEEFILGE
jgi:glycosyltransferase involved in cell wall biosynthesis